MDFERYLFHIGQPVLILDKLRQVLTINPAFKSLFPRVELAESICVFTEDYPALLPLISCDEGEYAVEHGGRHYSASISFTRSGKRRKPVARCILLTDVTETVMLLREIEHQSRLLDMSNEQIRSQNAELEEIIRFEREAAALRAQAQLLRDIHDTLGHTLVMVNALHTLALGALPDEDEAREKLREIVKWIGVSIAELESAGDYCRRGFTDFLCRFRDSMEQVGLLILLEISGTETQLHRYMYADLMRICQEAATNAIKHGDATRLCISYHAGGDEISLRIKDNGRAKQIMGNGHGLTGMDERVNNLFGDLDYGWDEDGGFFVAVTAPVIRDDEDS